MGKVLIWARCGKALAQRFPPRPPAHTKHSNPWYSRQIKASNRCSDRPRLLSSISTKPGGNPLSRFFRLSEMKATIFLLALWVLCLSLCSTFAKNTRALLKCKTKKGGQITRGTLITRKNWSSSDLESKKMTWEECREFCEEYTNYGYLPKAKCAGWSYAYDLAFDTVPVSLILTLWCSLNRQAVPERFPADSAGSGSPPLRWRALHPSGSRAAESIPAPCRSARHSLHSSRDRDVSQPILLLPTRVCVRLHRARQYRLT